MHSDEESYRGTLRARNVDGEPHTVIVMRRGLGRNARVWLTVNGALKTTLQMTGAEAARLVELLTEARQADRLMPERSAAVDIAMRRVSRGSVAKLSGHWLDGGRPVSCFLPDALVSLIEAGFVALADPDPDNAGQRRAVLTDAGAVRYAALIERYESR